jgi:hypothetical protein
MIHGIHDLSFYYSRETHKKKVWYLIFQHASEGTYPEAKPCLSQDERDNEEKIIDWGFHASL